ncbi:MAG TPA: DNA polymerase III subunit delta [Streptosporangiaceae bacterium]|jgi:DNA polymerase-3 subunit delta|nr:DNA polymerase III subunit delta [Streptosporangiaceae bacterium]
MPLAPVNLVVGEEELLVERSVTALLTAARESPDVGDDHHDVAAGGLGVGELAALTSPSLFGGGGVVIIRATQDATKDVAEEISRYVADPAPDVVLVLTHAGGNKGKTLLAALKKNKTIAVTDCPKITRFSDKLDFIRGEFRRAGKVADESGLRALLDAVGSDLREIAAACSQLAADVEGPIGEAAVARYYQGRAEASGFSVSDRTVEGRLADALEQLRWALATGVPPVLITSALAQGIRLLGRVGAAPRGKNSAALAAEVGAPPWKIDRVRQQLRGWAPDGVARALQLVAEADMQIKGEAASADYALERAVRNIVACRS